MSSVPLSPILEATAWWSNMYYIARSPSNKLLAVQDEEGEPTQEMYHLVDLGYTLYSVTPQGGGTFLLTPQQVVNPVTEQRLVGGTFTDA